MKGMIMSNYRNFGTDGFMQQMTNKDKGVYVVVGQTFSGKTHLMKQYLGSFPKDVKKSIFTENSNEYMSVYQTLNAKVITHLPYLNLLMEHSGAVAVDDDRGLTDEHFQNILFASGKSNIAVVKNQVTIHSFIDSFRKNPEFMLGSRSLMDQVKGVTRTHRVTVDNEPHYLTESIKFTQENIERFLILNFSELEEFVEDEIQRQGMSTIHQQIALIKNHII